MPKILIIDTYYPDFLRTLPFDPRGTYETELQKVLDKKFGTADFYSRNLRDLGWDAVDVIYNHEALQSIYMKQYEFMETREIRPLIWQIERYDPDIIFLQDLSIPLHTERPIAAQCSCPWPGDKAIQRCHVVFTSFPHYVPRIEALGVKVVYNPLAFEPSVLARSDWQFLVHAAKTDNYDHVPRIHDCVFIGGVGNPSHWRRGMQVLETVARKIPTFKWWGYGADKLPASSALRQKYQGEAWGTDMYEILLQSKICLNRHGEVAEGFANNMRMYEATGCGALLVTDNDTDLFAGDEIARYASPEHAVQMIRFYLDASSIASEIAEAGRRRTLRDHTYARRMKVVSDTLEGMLRHRAGERQWETA